MEDQKYNGWQNRDTWVIALWMGNEKLIEEMIEEWIEELETGTTKEDAITEIANQIKAWINAEIDDALETMADEFAKGIISDMIDLEDGNIDWEAIAEGYLEDYQPEKEDEEVN
jgi:hypothetical protein